MTPGDTGSANVSGSKPAESLSGCKSQQERPINHQPRKENHMNTIQKAILRACWQEEQCAIHAPQLRWLVIRVVGMTTIPSRKSEKSQLAKEQWLALRKDAALRTDPETAEVYCEHGQICDPYGVGDLSEEYRNISESVATTLPVRPGVTFGFRSTTCQTRAVIALVNSQATAL
jgi:hypothetical protein